MPILGFIHFLIALFFAIHAVRNRQNLMWLFILFSFPFLGSAVYFFAIYLPEFRASRLGRSLSRGAADLVAPDRELHEAEKAFEMTPTVSNRIRMAVALSNAGFPDKALEQYQQVLNGPFANDPVLLLGMARAQLETDQAKAALTSFEKLFSSYPQRRQQPSEALLYARCLGELGDTGARDAFDLALTVASGPEAKCFYADWLSQSANEPERARALYEEVVCDERFWDNAYSRKLNGPWLEHARQALSQMGLPTRRKADHFSG